EPGRHARDVREDGGDAKRADDMVDRVREDRPRVLGRARVEAPERPLEDAAARDLVVGVASLDRSPREVDARPRVEAPTEDRRKLRREVAESGDHVTGEVRP